MILVHLFYEFFKTGLFSVGGGLATLPFLAAIGRKTGWFGTDDLANMVAVSESTPGPLGVNMSTYVGFTTMGIIGSITATLGLIAPAIVVICIIQKLLDKFRDSAAVQKIFYGLRPASVAMITAAGLGVAKLSLLDLTRYQRTGSWADLFAWKAVLLAAVILPLYKKFKLHPVVYIAGAAVSGIVFGM